MYGAETYDDSVDNSVEFVPSEPEIHVDRGVATFAQRDTVKEESYVAAQLGSEQSSQKSNEISSDLVTTHVKESGTILFLLLILLLLLLLCALWVRYYMKSLYWSVFLIYMLLF